MTQQIERDTLNSVRPHLPYTELSGFEVLTDDERAIQQAMHAFARDVMRPTGIAIDKLTAEPAIAPSSPYRELMTTAAASGIEFDTSDDDVARQAMARLQSNVIEEFGWGDIGLRVSLAAASFPNMMAKRIGNQELV